MSNVGIVAMIFGALIVCSRGPLLLAPVATLHWFSKAIETRTRTRVLGAFVVALAASMAWAGASQGDTLESLMFIFGVLMLLFVIPALLLFPSVYMSLASSFIPDDPSGFLFGWRMLGLVSVIIGAAIFMIGRDAL
ncbi:MAG: hypothetical protein ACR2PZ_02835 [Pseudomonadales bacterium]